MQTIALPWTYSSLYLKAKLWLLHGHLWLLPVKLRLIKLDIFLDVYSGKLKLLFKHPWALPGKLWVPAGYDWPLRGDLGLPGLIIQTSKRLTVKNCRSLARYPWLLSHDQFLSIWNNCLASIKHTIVNSTIAPGWTFMAFRRWTVTPGSMSLISNTWTMAGYPWSLADELWLCNFCLWSQTGKLCSLLDAMSRKEID